MYASFQADKYFKGGGVDKPRKGHQHLHRAQINFIEPQLGGADLLFTALPLFCARRMLSDLILGTYPWSQMSQLEQTVGVTEGLCLGIKANDLQMNKPGPRVLSLAFRLNFHPNVRPSKRQTMATVNKAMVWWEDPSKRQLLVVRILNC